MNFNDYINDIYDFFRNSGVQIDPIPSIKIDTTKVGLLDPFIRTGNYNTQTNVITLFVNNRHLKDILRSFCHELIHHNQNITNPEQFSKINKTGNLSDNSELEALESDAYTRGNILFRKWTESKR